MKDKKLVTAAEITKKESASDTAGFESRLSPVCGEYPVDMPTLPFMQTHRQEVALFDDYHDEPLRVHVVILNDLVVSQTPVENARTAEKVFEGVINRLPKQYTPGIGCDVELQYDLPSYIVMPKMLADQLSIKQRRWLADGLYVQVGFSLANEDCWFNVNPAIATAMTLFDADVVGSNSVHPKDHGPKKFVSMEDRDLVFEVNRVFDFKLGIGDWNHSLVAIRNEILIKVGAQLRGLDAESEFKRFVAEGHSYFLDFTFSK